VHLFVQNMLIMFPQVPQKQNHLFLQGTKSFCLELTVFQVSVLYKPLSVLSSIYKLFTTMIDSNMA